MKYHELLCDFVRRIDDDSIIYIELQCVSADISSEVCDCALRSGWTSPDCINSVSLLSYACSYDNYQAHAVIPVKVILFTAVP